MTAAIRREQASFLAAVAAIGLVVLPLLHAEDHRREQREDEAEAAQIAEAFRAESGDPLDALAWALDHVHDPGPRGERPEHGHPAPHQHSHGPGSGGTHGSGAPQHLGLALHSAPALPQIEAGVQVHAAPAPVVSQLRTAPSYLVPEWPQGPPPRVS